MINYIKGDLLSVTDGLIIHGCNAQGVMGSGVAKAIKDKYPGCFIRYHQVYQHHGLQLGSIVYWQDPLNTKLLIANAITQEYFGTNQRHVNYAAVAKVFMDIFDICPVGTTVSFPKIGAGMGGGSWNIIEQVINDADWCDQFVKNCYVLE